MQHAPPSQSTPNGVAATLPTAPAASLSTPSGARAPLLSSPSGASALSPPSPSGASATPLPNHGGALATSAPGPGGARGADDVGDAAACAPDGRAGIDASGAPLAALAPHHAPLSPLRLILNPLALGLLIAVGGLAAVPQRDPLLATWWTLLTAGGGVAVTLLRGRAFRRADQEGLARLAAGDPASAAAIFHANARRFRWLGRWHAGSVFHLALCRMRLGRLDEARALFSSTMRAYGARALPGVPAAARCHAATCAALCGEPDEALALLHEAEARFGAGGTRLGLLAKATALCRRGHHEEARALLEACWRSGEAALVADVMRALRVVRAFATLQGARTRDDERAAQDLLAGARPFRAGDYDWLGVEWPEMRAFLSAHGLSAHGLLKQDPWEHGARRGRDAIDPG